MSTVEEIERAAEQLSPEEFARLAAWVDQRRGDAWDAQIEADAKSGRLDTFIEEALADLREGRTQPMP